VLNSLRKLISTPQKATDSDELELKLAAATLMFEVVRSDGQVDKVELDYLKELLKKEFQLDKESLEELMERAQNTAEQAISLHSFTREICENWGNEKRSKLLEQLWILALADDRIDPHERHLVRKVAGLLYLNDAEIVQCRERAKQQLTPPPNVQ